MHEYRIIELIADNHPGVMYRITGLFSRRAANIEGILCRTLTGGGASRMFLLVREDGRADNIVKQLRNLYEVREAFIHTEGTTTFGRIMEMIAPED